MREAAVVECEVGVDAGFFVGAVLSDECAFVFRKVDESALNRYEVLVRKLS